MDVTHIPSFGRLQYLHVSIDTYSGIMYATPLTGEKASHVINIASRHGVLGANPDSLRRTMDQHILLKNFGSFAVKWM